MPYRWTPPGDTAAGPAWHLCLWPYRSLSSRGFVAFFAATCGMLTLPLAALIGTAILWVILPFMAAAVGATWIALRRNDAQALLREDLELSPEQIELVRTGPRGARQSWQANPYWVRLELHERGGPVENYVTLTGAGRSVEIGAFLSPEERVALHRDLSERLNRLDRNA